MHVSREPGGNQSEAQEDLTKIGLSHESLQAAAGCMLDVTWVARTLCTYSPPQHSCINFNKPCEWNKL